MWYSVPMLELTPDAVPNTLADEEILLRSRAEPWLFAALLDRYQDAFLRKAESILHSPLDSEEVVQDAFTKIYLNMHKFEVREGAKFSSWAYTIVINTALTRYMKRKRAGERVTALDPEFEQRLSDAHNHREQKEGQDEIERILERIPGHFAAVLRLHYLERWSHKDIADHIGSTVAAVKTRIHRAKAVFKKEYEESSGKPMPQAFETK
jgi:RNA polymerase sigma-70 factor, ECF subfamily